MGHFSDIVLNDIFGACNLFVVLYVDKHGIKCPVKALNCVKFHLKIIRAIWFKAIKYHKLRVIWYFVEKIN